MVGLDKMKEIIESNMDKRPILVYFDPDVDGLISGLLACQFLDSKQVKYSYYMNSKRQHGFTLQPSSLNGYLIIAVDFDIPEIIMQSLVDNNVSIVSLDHHSIQDSFIDVSNSSLGTRGVVLNNQYPFEPDEDEYLSGAGVVYEAISSVYPEFKSKEREALVGITLLSDARPIENKKARRYLKTTYDFDPNDGYMKYLITSVIKVDYGFGVPRMDRNFIDYTLSPRINSLLRFGKETEALDFILGKGLNSATNTKELQTELVKVMKQRAQYLDMSDITVVALNSDDFSDFGNIDISSFIGLLCSGIKGTGKSTLGFVYDNGKIVRASFRGKYDDVHYLTGFKNLGIHADGHPPAFGIKDFEPTTELWNDINELVRQLDEGHTLNIKVVESSNLSFSTMQHGMEYATENCYVRDMYRIYFKYVGKNAKIVNTTYTKLPMTKEDYETGVKPDYTFNKKKYKYLRDSNGNPIPKYIEYIIDGKKVKSFGVSVENGLILPIYEKGHINLYLREMIT